MLRDARAIQMLYNLSGYDIHYLRFSEDARNERKPSAKNNQRPTFDTRPPPPPPPIAAVHRKRTRSRHRVAIIQGPPSTSSNDDYYEPFDPLESPQHRTGRERDRRDSRERQRIQERHDPLKEYMEQRRTSQRTEADRWSLGGRTNTQVSAQTAAMASML